MLQTLLLPALTGKDLISQTHVSGLMHIEDINVFGLAFEEIIIYFYLFPE